MKRGRKHFFQMLSSNGDGSGITNAIGDYSETPLILKLQSPGSRIVVVNELHVKIQDTGSFDASKYGNNIVLTKGIVIRVCDAQANMIDDMTCRVIKTSGDWAAHCRIYLHKFGQGDEILTVENKLSHSGKPFTIDFSKGQCIEVELNDNFEGLNVHEFSAHGYHRHEYYK